MRHCKCHILQSCCQPGSQKHRIARGASHQFMEVEVNCNFRLMSEATLPVPLFEHFLENLKYPDIVRSANVRISLYLWMLEV